MLKELLKLANELDRKGLYIEASMIDKILKQAAEYEERGGAHSPEGDNFIDTGLSEPEEVWPDEYLDGESGATKHEPLSEEDRKNSLLVALKHRLHEVFGNKIKQMTLENLNEVIEEFGLIDVIRDPTLFLKLTDELEINEKLKRDMGQKIDILIDMNDPNRNDELYKMLMGRNQCIMCSGDTGTEYVEMGEDVVSPPLCPSCVQEEIPPHMKVFLSKNYSGKTYDIGKMYEVPTDPGELDALQQKDIYDDDPDEYDDDEDYADTPLSLRVKQKQRGDESYFERLMNKENFKSQTHQPSGPAGGGFVPPKKTLTPSGQAG